LRIKAGVEIELEPALERAKKLSQKTDVEIVEQDRLFRLHFQEEQNSEESEKQANLIKKIPELRQRWAQATSLEVLSKTESPYYSKNILDFVL
jgi:hypothetical protein